TGWAVRTPSGPRRRAGTDGAGCPVPPRQAFFDQMNQEFHMSSKAKIKRIPADKGFGFVADESGHEYFFHKSACQSFESLREGQAVTFQTGQGPKGPRAENAREAWAHRPHFLGG